jgi:hypothetical protein
MECEPQKPFELVTFKADGKKQLMKKILTLFLIALVIAGCGRKKTAADLIIQGGKIYTMNAQQPEVEAVAVAGGKIIYAGDADGVVEFQGEKTNSIDLKGRTMTPGLIEGHGHFMGLGYIWTIESDEEL